MFSKTNIKAWLKSAIKINWFISVGLAIVTLFVVKFFLFDVVKITSNDMQPNFEIGNTLLIKKYPSNYNYNDVVVFKYPNIDSNEIAPLFIQRIVALPGDCLSITNKELYINNTLIDEIFEKKYNYIIKFDKIHVDSVFWKKYKVAEYASISNENDYSATLKKWQYDTLSKLSTIKKIEIKLEKPKLQDETCFPFDVMYKWNLDNFGKLYVPKKNDTLTIDSATIILYKHIINLYEKNNLIIKNDSVFINGNYRNKYVFKQNYYFTMGDNRDNAIDSRTFGFVPQNYIIGKVLKNNNLKN